MLCRALIAAVALTCTLSCARGQASQRLDRIKDLMCVLLLSGMQKEDLVVSMLTKLQRHNVNIDDMNNEKFLQACIKSRDNNSIEKVKNITGATPFTSQLKNADLGEYKTNADLEMLKTPRNLQKVSYNLSTDYKINHEFHEDNNKAPKENADENKSNVDKETQYPGQDGHGLEIVLKYLQDMRVNKAVKHAPMPQTVSLKEHETKRSITDDVRSSETDTLSRLIANFLSKRKNLSTKATTTQKTLNIKDLYEKLYSLRIQDNEKMSNDNSGFQQSFTSLPIQQKEGLKLSSNLYLNNFQRTESMNTTSTNVESQHKLSRNMIKEIADSVKELILKDLRKELHATTMLTTTTTMSTTTTKSTTKTDSTLLNKSTIIKKENTNTQDSIMNKFLELFEEIKSLKQNTIVIPKEEGINNKETRPDDDIKEFTVFPKLVMPARIPNTIIQPKLSLNANQAYEIKHYPTLNSENTFNVASQVHTYRLNGKFEKQEPKILNKDLRPITVQTNNIEIPPLSIPLDKSHGLIRQNIIITTTIPHRIVPIVNGPIEKRNQHTDTQHSEASKAYQSKQLHPRLSKETYKSPAHELHSNSKHNVIRFKFNNNEHFKYDADYYEKINIGKYKPRPNSDEIKAQEIPRFHEKLEKVERNLDYPVQNMYTDKNDCCNEKFRYSQAMVDCCNRKIASRHQMSLNNKKNKSYDGTHFKNFLQSQQKVTDMLEKILGDKANVESVETA